MSKEENVLEVLYLFCTSILTCVEETSSPEENIKSFEFVFGEIIIF